MDLIDTIITADVIRDTCKKTEPLYYLVQENHHTCMEVHGERATPFAKAFGLKIYTHFPYAEYGFEDPYSFVNEWSFFDEDCALIKYDENFQEILG